MKNITKDNLHEFAPSYEAYEQRLERVATSIGLAHSQGEARDHSPSLREWNQASAIGFTEPELQMLELIYSVDQHNHRFDKDDYTHARFGGNTAEHPIFMGLAFDRFKDVAGLGVKEFDAAAPDALELARLSQRIHGLIAVHDIGEVVDVSFSEQKATGASFKEPEEEALVAPFKFRLASFALSTGQPELYRTIMTDMKATALATKRELFDKAMAGEISGDDFVRGFGKVIGEKMDAAESIMHAGKVSPEFGKAAADLTSLFDESEKKETLAGHILGMVDKFEGAAHYGFFAGKAAKDHGAATPEQDAEKRMLNRIFGKGESQSFALANSPTVIGELKYSQKPIASAFAAADAEPEATRSIAQKLVGATAGGILRARIALLQKSAPFLDFNATDASDTSVKPTADRAQQVENFTTRLEAQRGMRDAALDGMKERKGNITSVGGVMDTKALIAVLRKTAIAMESGQWRPQGKTHSGMVFELNEQLPVPLQVDKNDLKASAQEYPLDVAQDYRHDKLGGQSVSL